MYASFLKGAAGRYLLSALLCALFSAVYLHFSHGISSPWMRCLCCFPLLLGFVPSLLTRRRPLPAAVPLLHRCALLTLTLYALLRGVTDIYGTQARLLFVYPIAAAALWLLALLHLLRRKK